MPRKVAKNRSQASPQRADHSAERVLLCLSALTATRGHRTSRRSGGDRTLRSSNAAPAVKSHNYTGHNLRAITIQAITLRATTIQAMTIYADVAAQQPFASIRLVAATKTLSQSIRHHGPNAALTDVLWLPVDRRLCRFGRGASRRCRGDRKKLRSSATGWGGSRARQRRSPIPPARDTKKEACTA